MILTAPGSNTKLGPQVVSWSRPVGPTCPKNCPFLTGDLPDGSRLPAAGLCYADRLQKACPQVATAWERNAQGTDWIDWGERFREELSAAGKAGYAVRGHVGGDFLARSGKVDRLYIGAVIYAFRRAQPRPVGWVYTHAWRELGGLWLRLLKEVAHLEVFASTHSMREDSEAQSLGYRLALDGGYSPDNGGPAWIGGALACPEQRLGHEKITCSECRYCFRPGCSGDVILYRHWPGAPNYRPGGRHVES